MAEASAAAPATSAPMMLRELDSPEQAFAYETEHAAATTRLLGAVRVALLLSGSVLLTDSMLLDGRFFLTLGPDGLTAALGLAPGPLPLRVLARGGSLRRAVDEQAVAGTWREHAEAGGESAPVGVPDPQQWVAHRREEWVRAAEQGRFPVDPYGSARFELDLEAGRSRLGEFGETGRSLVADLEGEVSRSRAFGLIDAARDAHDVLPGDLEQIGRWWNEAYLRAIASQHGADWFFLGTPAEPRDPASPGPLAVSGALLDTVREMPPGMYAAVVHTTRTSLQRYHRTRRQRELDRLAFAVRTAIPAVPPWIAVVRGLVARIALAAAAIVLSLPALPDVIRIGAGIKIDPAVAAIVAVLLTTFPWQEILGLLDAGRRKHEATVVVAR